MTPQSAIAALDNKLARNGEDVVLQRITGTTNQATFSAECRAFVRGYTPQQLVGGIIQGDSAAVLSPTDLIAAGWPGGSPLPGRDPLVPVKGDKLVIKGRQRNIEAATPFYLDDSLVRLELQLRG